MSGCVLLKPRAPLPSDFAGVLRDLADAVERGEVAQCAVACVRGGAFEFLLPSSLHDSLVLAALLHHRCVERFKEGG